LTKTRYLRRWCSGYPIVGSAEGSYCLERRHHFHRVCMRDTGDSPAVDSALAQALTLTPPSPTIQELRPSASLAISPILDLRAQYPARCTCQWPVSATIEPPVGPPGTHRVRAGLANTRGLRCDPDGKQGTIEFAALSTRGRRQSDEIRYSAFTRRAHLLFLDGYQGSVRLIQFGQQPRFYGTGLLPGRIVSSCCPRRGRKGRCCVGRCFVPTCFAGRPCMTRYVPSPGDASAPSGRVSSTRRTCATRNGRHY